MARDAFGNSMRHFQEMALDRPEVTSDDLLAVIVDLQTELIKTKAEQELGHIPFIFMDRRPEGWKYCGWFPLRATPKEHAESIARMSQSDHGEERAVDEYPRGCVCWCKEGK